MITFEIENGKVYAVRYDGNRMLLDWTIERMVESYQSLCVHQLCINNLDYYDYLLTKWYIEDHTDYEQLAKNI